MVLGRPIKHLCGRVLWRTWYAMVGRCTNPKVRAYKNYGARGIKVCDAWLNDVEQFARDVGPRPPNHSLDRIDNDDDYKPSNCRWATRAVQGANRRPRIGKPRRFITWNGRTAPIVEWAKEIGVTIETLSMRLHNGWSLDDALNSANTRTTHRYVHCRERKRANSNPVDSSKVA